MTILSIEQVPSELPKLIGKLAPGDEIVVTDGGKPVAKVTPMAPDERPRRRLGSAKGILTIISEDDDHLQDFAEYM